LPGIELVVTGKVRPAPGLNIIQLREVTDSPVVLLKPPFTQSSVTELSINLEKSLLLNQQQSTRTNELRVEVQDLVQQIKMNTVKHRALIIEIDDLSVYESKAIVDALSLNKNIFQFIMLLKTISNECFEIIMRSLRTNRFIKTLTFGGARGCLIPVAGSIVADVLLVNKEIKKLCLWSTTINDNDFKIITEALKRNRTVAVLYMMENPHLTVQSAVYLSDLIKSTTTLNHVTFDNNFVDNESTVLIASALKSNQSIKTMRMTGGKMSDECGNALGQMLEQNKTIEELWLHNNRLTDISAKALAKGMRSNSTLKEFWIGGNQFTETSEGGRSLMEAAKAKGVKINWW
ncbi:unnamed protein product, partial [Didymodactylos carnosus]